MATCECTNTGLDLFSTSPIQTSIETGMWIENHPLATIGETGPIEFVVKGSGEEYVDLANTYLHVQAKVVREDGTDLTVDDDRLVAPTNSFLSSLFSEIDISLNGVQVSTSTGAYGYKTYIENLINYGSDAKETQLELAMFYKRKPGEFPFTKDGTTSKSLETRRARIQRSKVCDLLGRINGDIFAQDKFLLNGVDMRLRLVRAKNSFALLALPANAGEQPNQYKVKIVHASVFVRKVKLNPAIALAHAKVLQTATAKYPIKRVLTKIFSAPQGNMNVVQDNLFMNQRPNRLLIGFVDSKAFNGSYALSPFNFKHYDLNHLALHVDGQQIPTKALKPNFKNGLYARSYMSLFSGTNTAWKDVGNCIDYRSYSQGETLFCFDLTPSLACGDMVEILKTASIRLEVGFENPLPNPIHIIVYAELDGLIEIDRARQVITDFSS